MILQYVLCLMEVSLTSAVAPGQKYSAHLWIRKILMKWPLIAISRELSFPFKITRFVKVLTIT